MKTLKAKKKGRNIIIPTKEFEHLLNCLDNQKFIHELNADAMEGGYKSVQKENQAAIDKMNRNCRKVLHS